MSDSLHRTFWNVFFFNENIWTVIDISLTFVPQGQINNIPSLVQIMAWRRPGDKPLSEPMMVNSLKYICVTRPQWVKVLQQNFQNLHLILFRRLSRIIDQDTFRLACTLMTTTLDMFYQKLSLPISGFEYVFVNQMTSFKMGDVVGAWVVGRDISWISWYKTLITCKF